MIQRRSFLKSLTGTIVAPFVVRDAVILMPVKTLIKDRNLILEAYELGMRQSMFQLKRSAFLQGAMT